MNIGSGSIARDLALDALELVTSKDAFSDFVPISFDRTRQTNFAPIPIAEFQAPAARATERPCRALARIKVVLANRSEQGSASPTVRTCDGLAQEQHRISRIRKIYVMEEIGQWPIKPSTGELRRDNRRYLAYGQIAFRSSASLAPALASCWRLILSCDARYAL